MLVWLIVSLIHGTACMCDSAALRHYTVNGGDWDDNQGKRLDRKP
jgi:hypothetical protein